MITEDYVSFETAKLLKEKGFDEPCQFLYFSKYKPEGDFVGNFNARKNSEINEASYSAPTLQTAMKWLREKHNLGVFPSWSQVFGLYGCRMYYLKKGSQEFYSVGVRYNTYEEACEAAIKYCLENLI